MSQEHRLSPFAMVLRPTFESRSGRQLTPMGARLAAAALGATVEIQDRGLHRLSAG